MKVTAIYPGTFDPITNGHSDIVARASILFDKVIVSVADSTSKNTTFNTDQRVELVSSVLSSIENVEVCAFRGLVVEHAKAKRAAVIIRGLRAVSDFEYEFQMAGMNRKLYDAVETIFLTPAEHLNYISSGLVKDIANLGGNVSEFVPKEVMLALQEHYNK